MIDTFIMALKNVNPLYFVCPKNLSFGFEICRLGAFC